MGRGCEDQDGAEDQEDDDDDDDEWNPVCQGAAVGHDENGHAKDGANNDAEEDEEEEVRTQTHVGCTFLSFPLGLVYVNGLCFIHILVIFFQKLKTEHVVAFFQPSTIPLAIQSLPDLARIQTVTGRQRCKVQPMWRNLKRRH